MPKFDSQSFSKDFVASIVVFLVALPLCMGIAIASGVPPAKGLITGIVGGIVVGFLAGAPLQVSGPAAGLAVIVYKLVQDFGLEVLGVALIGAGAIQLAAGLLRLGQWFRAMSPAVIHGMLAGIGVLIFGSQFHVMVDDRPRGNGIADLLSIPEAIWKGVIAVDGGTHHQAAAIGLLTIVSLILWDRLKPARVRMVPGVLFSVVLATLVAAWMRFPVQRVQVPANLLHSVNLPDLATATGMMSGELLVLALTLAFVASAETLLCATAVDQMQSETRTNYDRELAAQGVGNLLCGFAGALPMTGVIVRSSANVQAGARTRVSAILHGVWLLLFVVAAPGALAWIPTSCLAAVLVFTGYRLVNITQIRKLASLGRGEVAIYAATLIGIVVANLLTGVILGIALAVAKLLYTFSHLRIDVEAWNGRTEVWLAGAATFVRLPQLAEVLEAIPSDAEVHVHVEDLAYVDHACIELLTNWERQHQGTGGKVVIEWLQVRARYGGVSSASRSGPRREAAASRPDPGN